MTEDDANSLYYFHFERGDIERWASWESRKKIIFDQHLELLHAFQWRNAAIDNLNNVIKKICESGPEPVSKGCYGQQVTGGVHHDKDCDGNCKPGFRPVEKDEK